MRKLFGKVQDKNKTWHEVELFKDKDNDNYVWETFCEYLFTKDNMKYYEGDVIKLTELINPNMVITTELKWYDYLNGFGIKDYKKNKFENADHLNEFKLDYLFRVYKIEKLGNIIDNPEFKVKINKGNW